MFWKIYSGIAYTNALHLHFAPISSTSNAISALKLLHFFTAFRKIRIDKSVNVECWQKAQIFFVYNRLACAHTYTIVLPWQRSWHLFACAESLWQQSSATTILAYRMHDVTGRLCLLTQQHKHLHIYMCVCVCFRSFMANKRFFS